MSSSNVIRNPHLTVEFEEDRHGLRLASIEYAATGESYRFARYDEVGLVVLAPQAVVEPEGSTEYRFREALKYEGAVPTKADDGLALTFRDGPVRIEVCYLLEANAPVLRKTVRCFAEGDPAYIAGVMHWAFEIDGLRAAWPEEDGTYLQPGVFFGKRSGCFATLEWPLTTMTNSDGRFGLEFRPGYSLEPGQSKEVTAGSIGFFALPDSAVERLELARRAFFEHITARIRPNTPFPIKFTTWGPWLGQVSESRIRQVIDDLEYVGTDILHIDASWQELYYPYSDKLQRLRHADDETWDRGVVEAGRFPDGLLPVKRLATEHGMDLSLWFDACGSVFVREGEQWAVRDREGNAVYNPAWETRNENRPKQSLASEYGDRLREFVMQMYERYDLGGIMFDNNSYAPDYAPGRRSMANGWNAENVQIRTILEILAEGERRKPGIYRFYCWGRPWPWALLYATHLHAGDPSTSNMMKSLLSTDYPLRGLAFERRAAWRTFYNQFVPPWGIKGDIAGWSVQQKSPIPINPRYTAMIPGVGEGWTQNMFTCFAMTTVRDIRFHFPQVPDFDREILKEWLAWDRRRSEYSLVPRPVVPLGSDPNAGLDVIAQIRSGKGVLYIFNQSFEKAEAVVELDERAGFSPEDKDVRACLVYPLKAELDPPKLSYGDRLTLPVIGKDCAVVEFGLETPDGLQEFGEYEAAASSVIRSFDTIFLTGAADLLDAFAKRFSKAFAEGLVRVEVGGTSEDRALALPLVETMAAAAGCRRRLEEFLRVPAGDAACRLIVGTYDGLQAHPEIGPHFRQTLYNRYVEWQDKLYSAPVALDMGGDSGCPTCALIAPRPEQLARLALNLAQALIGMSRGRTEVTGHQEIAACFSVRATVPEGAPALCFRPLVQETFGQKNAHHYYLPEDMELIRFTLRAETGGEEYVVWQQDVAPFYGPQWWQERIVSVADMAGKDVTFRFSAAHIDGKGHPLFAIGFDRLSFVEL